MAIQQSVTLDKSQQNGRFQLGEWTVEPGLLRLFRDGRTVAVGPKVMGVLVHLAHNAGRPVSRDDLLAAVWPDVVVVEGVLTRVISQLRHVFDDDPKAPRYIETIRSSGYRLIAPVRFLPELEPVAAEPRAPATAAPPFRRRLFLMLLVASAGAAAILAGTVMLSRGRDASPSAQPLRPTPATAWPGLERDGALSPDGERIAFAWQEGGVSPSDIYVKTLADDGAVQLTDTPSPERHPVWSPDGTRLAFLRMEPGGRGTIIVVPAAGGEERVLAERAAIRPDLDWSPDGRLLAFSELAEPDGPTAVFVYEIATGERRQVSFPGVANHVDVAPAFSPDGREISFVRMAGSADRDVFVVPVGGGEERRLTHDSTIVAGQTWDPRGGGIVMASMRSGDWRLWRVPSTGGEPELLPIGAGKMTNPRFARDVPRLAFERRSVSTEIWSLRPAGGTATFEKWIASTGYNHELHYSRDGRRIAFISDRTGNDQVWIAGADGSGPQQVTRMDARFVASPRWSPDDRTIAFIAAPEGSTDLFALDVATGVVRRLVDDGADERAPAWSADGRSLYFASNRSGQFEAYVVDATGGEPTRLSRGGGFVPQPGPDGDALFILRGERDGIWRLPLGGGEPELVVEDLGFCDWGAWTVAGEGLYYFRRQREQLELARRDLGSGETSVVFKSADTPTTKLPCDMRTLDVAPDESRIAISLIGSFESDILWVDIP